MYTNTIGIMWRGTLTSIIDQRDRDIFMIILYCQCNLKTGRHYTKAAQWNDIRLNISYTAVLQLNISLDELYLRAYWFSERNSFLST